MRSLRRSPLVTVVAVVTIGIGIAAVTTLFSVFDAVWLEPLPMRESSRLAALTLHGPHGEAVGMSYPNFLDLRERTRAFETLSGFNLAELNVIADGRPELASAHQVVGDFFELMGFEAELGRGLRPQDDAPGAEPVVVLSHHYWMMRFAGERDIVGSTVSIEGASYRNVEQRVATIVGVLPRRAWFRANVDLWVPFYLSESERYDRGAISVWLFGRLGDEIDLSEARAEIEGQLARLSREYPDDNRGLRIEVEDAHAWLYGDEQLTVSLLLGAASLLLLIACGNVAHLLLARVSERRRELALRTALGAGRLRIVRLLSYEIALLACSGGALGLVLAHFGVSVAANALPRSLVTSLPEGAASIALDARVFGFALLVSATAMVASSFVPLWRSTQIDIVPALRASSGTDHTGRRLQPLIVSEVALSLVLLVGAGVTLRSSVALENASLGFEPEGVVDFWVAPSREQYPGPEERRAFYRELRRAVVSVPGVDELGFTNQFPHQMWTTRREFEVVSTDTRPTADVRSVDAGYFRTMKIALERGRHFDDSDSEFSRPVALVNRFLAERYWPDADALGKGLILFVDDAPVELVVVGVVDNVQVPLLAEAHPIIYRPWQQAPPMWIDLVFRPEAFSETLAESIRERIWSVDPDHFIEIYMNGDGPPIWFARTRFVATLLVAFSVVAFALSAAGVFSVRELSNRTPQTRNGNPQSGRSDQPRSAPSRRRWRSASSEHRHRYRTRRRDGRDALSGRASFWHRTHGWTHDVGRDTRSRRGRARRELDSRQTPQPDSSVGRSSERLTMR